MGPFAMLNFYKCELVRGLIIEAATMRLRLGRVGELRVYSAVGDGAIVRHCPPVGVVLCLVYCRLAQNRNHYRRALEFGAGAWPLGTENILTCALDRAI